LIIARTVGYGPLHHGETPAFHRYGTVATVIGDIVAGFFVPIPKELR
jgi:hypothetical protein